MGAAGGIIGNFALAEGAQAGSLCGSRSGLGLMQLVDTLDEQEDADGDHEEIHDGLNEIANTDFRRVGGFAQGNDKIGKIDAAGDPGDDGGEEIVDNAGDDSGKGRTDDNTDGHIDHIAAERKIFEFLNQFFHCKILRYNTYPYKYTTLSTQILHDWTEKDGFSTLHNKKLFSQFMNCVL